MGVLVHLILRSQGSAVWGSKPEARVIYAAEAQPNKDYIFSTSDNDSNLW